MTRPLAPPLLLLALAFAWAAFAHAAVFPEDWSVSLLAIGLASLLYWFRTPRIHLAPAIEPWLKWPAILLVCYAAFQLAPLPLGLLDLISPTRAELARALDPVAPGIRYAPVSAVPSATLAHVLRFAGYGAVFFLVRELVWQSWERPWRVTLPLLAVATAEAVLGMVQYFLNPGAGQATGTYINRNHFAGLMEMVLPLAVMYAAAVRRRGSSRRHSPAAPALRACILLACAGLMLAAAIYSLSRMGFLAALAGLFVTGALAAGANFGPRARRITGAAVVAAIALGTVFLPPDRLIERFAFLASADEISSDTRYEIWRETLDLIRAYPAVGCGLGAYESVFSKYQRVAPLNTVDYAHNDYLQYLAELGLVGFLIAAAFIAAVVVSTLRAVSVCWDPEERYLAVASLGAMAAIGLHSLVDFNLYMPANAMALAWIAGIGCGVENVGRRASGGWPPSGIRGVVDLATAPLAPEERAG